VGPLLSKATAIPLGEWSSSKRASIETNPNTAWVSCPEEFDI
jgi:hypothetical protein